MKNKILPTLYLKDDVIINGAHFYPPMVALINAFRATAPNFTDGAMWITSGNDGKHMDGSLHYKNQAFDIRIYNIVGGHVVARAWCEKARLILGADYDIILEVDHIHAEYQPRG